jgi:hypothetical protein
MAAEDWPLSAADITIIALAGATLVATLLGLIQARRTQGENRRERERDREALKAARDEDRTTTWVVERGTSQTGPDARTPLHQVAVHAHRAAARDIEFYWAADKNDRQIGESTTAKSMMPGGRVLVHLLEPSDVIVAHLHAQWADDAGNPHHDVIHDLRLHAGREP